MSELEKKPRDHVRFENHSMILGIGDKMKVVVVRHVKDDSGVWETVETDISDFVMAVEIPYTKVGSLSRIRLDVICEGVTHAAQMADVLAVSFKPRKLPRLRRLFDATTFARSARWWVST